MPDMSAPTHRDALGTAAAIRAGEVSAREVAEEAIQRIEEANPRLNAVVSRRYEEALAEIDAGLPEGPFTGVPFLIKDLGIEVGGLPATGGSRLFADKIAATDSELVKRYKRAGLVVLGMTNVPEFGLNASTEPQLYGPAHNPRDLTKSPGGSSGGSAAAVAAGLVPAAHATDGGGSIRIPAAMCGLVGLKPSRGRTTGAPRPNTLSGPVSVPNAVTTTVRDSAALLDVIAGVLPGEALAAPSPHQGSFLDAAGREPGRLRIGLATRVATGGELHPDVERAVLAAAQLCESLGHLVEETVPSFDPTAVARASAVAMGADLLVNIDDRLAELGRDLQPGDVEPFTQLLYGNYQSLTGVDVNRALRQLQQIGWDVGASFTAYDVLLTPTLAQPTPPLGLLDTTDPQGMYQHASTYAAWTSVFNVTGMPAISLPLGSDADGMPIGVQFAADLGQEAMLVSLAAQIEQAAPWQRLAS